MGLALVHGRARVGVAAPPVQVEVHLGGGLPSMSIVGLPEAAVREAKDRVRAAIQCAQFEFPARRITVNLAPADLPKHGGRFDLPIALGILAASGQIPLDALRDTEFVGELGLTGELRPVDGALPAALAVAQTGRRLVVPAGNAPEAALAARVDVRAARTLLEVCAMLHGRATLPAGVAPVALPATTADMRDVRGQARARRALEIAAAGGHHLLLVGPPGCGKTLLASRLPGLLPEPGDDEALEAAAVASVNGGLDPARWRQRPFRAPHHTASAVALAGGGSEPRPGEISLAHRGVLFLDELPEWTRSALEVLREPLESGVVTISRAARQAEFPARFQLVAAMNPCPCGWAGDASGRCRCAPDAVRRYRSRISGPLLDRIDLHVEVPRLPAHALRPDAAEGEASAPIRIRVEAARARQQARSGRYLLLVGPPGCGKTLLASRLPGLLPEPGDDEALEAAAVASVNGGLDPARWRQRPFRAPHHTASAVALAGGGSEPRPGEISLAHRGVLFLDELPEWTRSALEVLREPLESGVVTISRAARQAEFPARFQLVAAMNPCPCGWAGDASGRCRCAPDAVRRYRSRISGPLLDRIDLHVEVPRLPAHALRPDAAEGEASAPIRIRVEAARARQQARSGRCNAHLDQAATTAHCRLRPAEQQLLERAIESLQLSARAMHRILRVARTVADLDDSQDILAPHLAEALTYRGFTAEPVTAVA